MPCAEDSIGRRRVSPLMSAISRHSIRLSPMSGVLRNQYASCQIDLRRMTRASVCRTVMSGSGQNRKSSDVCFAPVSGHRQAVSACPKSANKRLMHPSNGISNRPSHKRSRAICGGGQLVCPALEKRLGPAKNAIKQRWNLPSSRHE